MENLRDLKNEFLIPYWVENRKEKRWKIILMN